MFLNIFLEVGIFLVFLLAILLFFFFLRLREKRKLLQEEQQKPLLSLDEILKTLKLKATSAEGLKESLDYVLNNYGKIHNFSLYQKILFAIILHPHTNKDIILFFDKELSSRNPKYKKRISDTITDTLKIR
ncbi:MAG: hypothetical protein COB42_00955 [Sulfurimonas sp.]|nr:MAG: hypothetical protein COB42_00955 [Sulfurimonas sp.]